MSEAPGDDDGTRVETALAALLHIDPAFARTPAPRGWALRRWLVALAGRSTVRAVGGVVLFLSGLALAAMMVGTRTDRSPRILVVGLTDAATPPVMPPPPPAAAAAPPEAATTTPARRVHAEVARHTPHKHVAIARADGDAAPPSQAGEDVADSVNAPAPVATTADPAESASTAILRTTTIIDGTQATRARERQNGIDAIRAVQRR